MADASPDYTRQDTTEDHPLFAGNAVQYRLDQQWRIDIPKAPSGCRVTRAVVIGQRPDVIAA